MRDLKALLSNLNYNLPPEERFDGPDYNAQHNEAAHAILDPTARRSDYADIDIRPNERGFFLGAGAFRAGFAFNDRFFNRPRPSPWFGYDRAGLVGRYCFC